MSKARKIKFRGEDAVIFEKLPKAWPIDYRFYYGIRHSDDDWGLPCTIESYVMVNRWGWIGFKVPLTKKYSVIKLTEKEQELFLGLN